MRPCEELCDIERNSASLRGTKQSSALVILSVVKGSIWLHTNRWFNSAHRDIREDCFVVPPRNDGEKTFSH